MDSIEYRPGLATRELIAEVRQLLATERRTERLICRYLADLADRVQRRQDLALHRYADELHAARSCFGLGAREARERIRVGRALRQLPAIERAFVEGELSYSRVREVTRMATATDEPVWLALARRLDMRALERRVAAARAAELDQEVSSFETCPRPKTRRVTFELSEQAYELLQQALEQARSLNGGCSDAEALERLAQEALSARAEPKPIRPWSWDELGLGTTQRGGDATQRGSSDCDDENQGTGAFDGRATQRGPCDSDDGRRADVFGEGATQRGACDSDDSRGADALEVEQRKARERDRWSEVNSRLLRAMGGRGRWIADTLIEASGLSASEVNSALTFLQLSGRIRRRADAFEPI